MKPWVWDVDGWLSDADGNDIIEYAGCGSHQAEVSKQHKALIAAAPLLLGALIAFEKEASYFANAIPVYRHSEALAMARRAIAAATGDAK